MGTFQIISGRQAGAMKVVIYGPEGIGKSTLASCFPEPLFIDPEGSTKFLDVSRFPRPLSWQQLLEQTKYVRDTPGLCRTLVLDTADWAEQLCIAQICAVRKLSGIEDMGYGKGYVYLAEEFGRLLDLLEEIVERGVNVVLTAHAMMRKFEQPDELGAYDRWELKLQKKTAPLVKEWGDLLLFANYKTMVVAVDDKGKKHKAQGGKRVMYTTHHPCWDAKNRLGLPEELPLDYAPLAQYFDASEKEPAAEPVPLPTTKAETPPPVQAKPPAGRVEYAGNPARMAEPPKAEPAPLSDLSGVPAVLIPLMLNAGVIEEEVRKAIAEEGYFSMDTPWKVMEESGFVEGWLVPYWSYITGKIMEGRDLPF